MAATVASYVPSLHDQQLFWKLEETRAKVELDLPEGFPKHIASPLAWKGSELDDKEAEWKLELTPEEVNAVDAALAKFDANHEDLSDISAETFDLPEALSKKLKKISDQVYRGVGFQIVRGLDPAKYSQRQALIIYAGMSSHVFPQRGFVDVGAKGVVAHVVNVQAGGKGPATTAPAFSNIPLSFHTDNCEVFAFFYMESATSGGQTILSSLWQTYNELAANRPDVVQTLAKPWVFDSFKPYDFQPPRHVTPLQTLTNKVPILFRFSRYGILGWQRKRNPNLPSPTQAQIDAADAVQFIAMKNSFRLPAKKGDLFFANDMALVHARDGFEEEGGIMKRHIIKMHFRDPEQGWAIPPELENEWRQVYSPNEPDGTRKETWHIYHEPGLEDHSGVNG